MSTSKRSILVPVDFSPSSEAALTLGATMAASMDASLTVAHVVHDPGDAPGYYHVKGRKKQLRRMEDVAAEMLEDFIARVAGTATDQAKVIKQATKLCVVGLPVTRILELVAKTNASMVVMGSAGRTGLARAMLGSKAEQIVRLCPVPVTIVKRPDDD